MPTATIVNIETGEQCGEIDAEGEVTTADETLREAVADLRANGARAFVSAEPPPDEPATIVDAVVLLQPDDTGFAAALCENLPSPYIAKGVADLPAYPLSLSDYDDEDFADPPGHPNAD